MAIEVTGNPVFGERAVRSSVRGRLFGHVTKGAGQTDKMALLPVVTEFSGCFAEAHQAKANLSWPYCARYCLIVRLQCSKCPTSRLWGQ